MKEVKDISELRKAIDSIDTEIIRLFENRMDVCLDIAEYKAANNKPVLDPDREKVKLESVVSKTNNPDYKDGVYNLFELLMAESRKLQNKHIGDNK